jgi:delta 1-pyrroline-5-carboxylate dehydrogenase
LPVSVFTGSTETARMINRTLAERDGPYPFRSPKPGGQNADDRRQLGVCPSR